MIFAYFAFILAGIGVAALFQALFVKTRKPAFLVCSVLWLLPICYEIWVLNTCTGECNIRVDLLYVFPLEIGLLAGVSLIGWRAYRQHSR
ncbi:MAG: hypothetical protein CMQ49_03390 [Gammaproteobacteria bacterium]|nr:hypothetical protein [Gammaproteobacteria bacterium]|tara:strand:+ start:51 stop:320 length:270 start_codon:yes stop_codon:yes gene_type:complete